MAKTKQVHVCRSCGADLLKKDQAVCHVCGARLDFDGISKFNTPDYLFYQRGDQVLELNAKDRDYQKSIDAIDFDLVNFIRKGDPEDKIASLYDSFFYVKHLILSDANPDTLRQVVKMGKLIGKLAISIEEYVKNQGGINVSGTVSPSEGNDDEESLRDP